MEIFKKLLVLIIFSNLTLIKRTAAGVMIHLDQNQDINSVMHICAEQVIRKGIALSINPNIIEIASQQWAYWDHLKLVAFQHTKPINSISYPGPREQILNELRGLSEEAFNLLIENRLPIDPEIASKSIVNEHFPNTFDLSEHPSIEYYQINTKDVADKGKIKKYHVINDLYFFIFNDNTEVYLLYGNIDFEHVHYTKLNPENNVISHYNALYCELENLPSSNEKKNIELYLTDYLGGTRESIKFFMDPALTFTVNLSVIFSWVDDLANRSNYNNYTVKNDSREMYDFFSQWTHAYSENVERDLSSENIYFKKSDQFLKTRKENIGIIRYDREQFVLRTTLKAGQSSSKIDRIKTSIKDFDQQSFLSLFANHLGYRDINRNISHSLKYAINHDQAHHDHYKNFLLNR